MHGVTMPYIARPWVTPEVQLKAVIAQGFQLLIVLVITDADDGQLGALQRLYEVSHATPVTRRHSVHLIHDQAHLHGSQHKHITALATSSAFGWTLLTQWGVPV